MPLYVHYGCGHKAPEGWANYDASPTLRTERLPVLGSLVAKNGRRFPANVMPGNIVRGLPIADDSADGVYSSNVLEHLTREDFVKAIANTFSMLRPGGIFRLVVPDLEAYARRYVAALDRGDTDGNDTFMRDSCLGEARTGNRLFEALRSAFGHSRHLWMWDYPAMQRELAAVGFSPIRRCQPRDFADPTFASVEKEEQFGAALAVEAIKPQQ